MGKKKSEKKPIIKRALRAVGSFFAKITAPVRGSRVWKFLRRTILRSPFRGYFVNSWKELKQVTWPNRKTALKLTFTVILFSAFFAVVTTSLDFGFEKLAQELFLR
jgi:preprotein translocase SecE subunit